MCLRRVRWSTARLTRTRKKQAGGGASCRPHEKPFLCEFVRRHSVHGFRSLWHVPAAFVQKLVQDIIEYATKAPVANPRDGGLAQAFALNPACAFLLAGTISVIDFAM